MTASGAHAGTRVRDTERTRTLAQWYCLLAGLTLVLAGVLGFVVDAGFDTGSDIQGDKLILFEVNGIHNLIHIASGAVLLAASVRWSSAKLVAIAFGVVYGLVTVIGLIDGETVLGLIPVNGADNVLHIALTALGLYAGFTSPGGARR
jgi:Domain of unknown function (DUF4383)